MKLGLSGQMRADGNRDRENHMMKKWMALAGALMILTIAGMAIGEGMIPVALEMDMDGTIAEGVDARDGIVTISRPGEYLLSGEMEQGQIFVNCAEDGKVTLYLNGVKVHNEQGPALIVGQCQPRLMVSLVDGTENVLSDGTGMAQGADDPDGVIYSRSDLTITGSGSLSVEAGVLNGIVSRDDIRIEGGKIDIQAAGHGIKGKDSVEISGGEIVIRAGKDGIKATNKKDPERGYVEISGGKISITCTDDALSFITGCRVTGGEIYITMAED